MYPSAGSAEHALSTVLLEQQGPHRTHRARSSLQIRSGLHFEQTVSFVAVQFTTVKTLYSENSEYSCLRFVMTHSLVLKHKGIILILKLEIKESNF